MTSDENSQQEVPQPETLFTTGEDANKDNNMNTENDKQEPMLSTPPQVEAQTPQSYYTIDGQESGSMLYDPWATVAMPNAAPTPPPTPAAVVQKGGRFSSNYRFTPGRLTAFAALAVVLIVGLVGGSIVFARSIQPPETTMQQPQPHKPMKQISAPATTPVPAPMHTQVVVPTVAPARANAPAPTATPARINTPAPTAIAVQPSRQDDKQTAESNTTTTTIDTFNRDDKPGSWGSLWHITDTANKYAFSVSGVGTIQAPDETQQQGAVFYTATIGSDTSNTTVDASVTFNFAGFFQNQQQSNMGIILRWQNANNYYKAYLDGVDLVIMAKINGQQTTLALVPFSAQNQQWYTLRFRIQGQTLEAKAWATSYQEPQWLLSCTDGELTHGKAGVRALLLPNNKVQMSTFQYIASASR
jgi:hypothetical protein